MKFLVYDKLSGICLTNIFLVNESHLATKLEIVKYLIAVINSSCSFSVKIHKETGKTEIFLKKMSPGVQWKCIGKYLDKHNKFLKSTEQG